MPQTEWSVLDVDLAEVWESPERNGYLRTLSWGDWVKVIARTDEHLEIRARKFTKTPEGPEVAEEISGFLVPRRASGITTEELTKPADENDILKVSFVDVQQGDGALIETPKGRTITLDGGDNQLFARFLAGRLNSPPTSAEHPRRIDCILISHGDADHFSGLTRIFESESDPGLNVRKRLFIDPARVFHNGLVKRPSSRPERDLLGPTVEHEGRTYLTGLVDNLLAVPDSEMNRPFLEWKRALEAYNKRRTEGGKPPIEIRRLSEGDGGAFDFLADELKVEVLGPLTETIDGQPALLYLGEPPRDLAIGHAGATNRRFSGVSPSHAINGHSVILRFKYGNVRFLFAGDLNEQAEIALTEAHQAGRIDLAAEVFKVPHHGSAEFSAPFLSAVSPVASIVSSGDESARKEYIHPRATLVAELGRVGRPNARPVVLVTELAAFFEMRGPAKELTGDSPPFFAFARTNFGLVKVRTNGRRLLVATNSGQEKLKEAYAYEVDSDGNCRPVAIRKV